MFYSLVDIEFRLKKSLSDFHKHLLAPVKYTSIKYLCIFSQRAFMARCYQQITATLHTSLVCLSLDLSGTPTTEQQYNLSQK